MRTTRGFDRLVTFVDAIVAIAIILLVLPLVDLAATGSARAPSGELFGAPLGQIGTFLLSFIVIARLWVAHHAMFERVRAYDPALLWWTLGWVLTIVFLPFPTELVTAHAHVLSVRELYIGTMAVSTICQAGLAILIARRPALRTPSRPLHHGGPDHLGALLPDRDGSDAESRRRPVRAAGPDPAGPARQTVAAPDAAAAPGRLSSGTTGDVTSRAATWPGRT